MTRTMLSLPTVTPQHLRQLVDDYGGKARAAEDLRVAPALLGKWISGELEPPFHFLVALWFVGPFGFNQAFSESHWTHQENWMVRQAAVLDNERLRVILAQVVRVLGVEHPALCPLGHAKLACSEGYPKNHAKRLEVDSVD